MKKYQRNLLIIGSIVIVLSGIYLTFALLPRNQNIKKENSMRKEDDESTPLLIAHGGGNKEFPDNTLEAFYNAYHASSDMMLETDVSITKDNVLILSHDISLDRKTNVTGLISDWNYSDLLEEKVNFGYTNPVKEDEDGINRLNGDLVKFKNDDGKEVLPSDVIYPSDADLEEGVIKGRDKEIYLVTSLEDLLVNFPNSKINIEIKQNGEIGIKAYNEAIRLLDKYEAYDRCVLASFHDEIFSLFKEHNKSLENENKLLMYSPSTGGVIKFYILYFLKLDYFYFDDISVFQLPMEQKGINLATKEFTQYAHKHNIAVHYWTIDDTKDMEYLISINADGIMTNYPHRLKEVYDKYN